MAGGNGGRPGGSAPEAARGQPFHGSGTPRADSRGIVDPAGLFSRVRFRRRAPAEALRPYVEHYWLIDWDLPEPYVSQVVPHPSVNLVFHRYGHAPCGAEVAGVGLGLFSITLRGSGRVCGVQFRPGGFRPFTGGEGDVGELTGRRLPFGEVFPVTAGAAEAVTAPGGEDERVAAADAFLLSAGPVDDPAALRAMELAHLVRTDRRLTRVGQLADEAGMSVRAVQRLFATCVGVSPKWVILRYRVHDALEAAGTREETDWAGLAGELGYSDQAHLVRDFTGTVGVPPAEYARAAARERASAGL